MNQIRRIITIVLLDMDRPPSILMHIVASNIVCSYSGANVELVLVDGRVVVEHGRVTGVNENNLLDGFQQKSERLRNKLQWQPGGLWPIE